MLVINSVLQNPTGTSLAAAQAFRILQIAEAYDFIVVEDDIYGDCARRHRGTRLASLDQLKRVIYLGSFSKRSRQSARRVRGVLAGRRACVTDQKMLVGMTSPELNERVVFKVLTEGHYRRHTERLRSRLDAVRENVRSLEKIGLQLFLRRGRHVSLGRYGCRHGRADRGRARSRLSAYAGCLFSPNQSPSTWMRFNIANCGDPELAAFLCRYLDSVARRAS